jgi:antitoxin HicB
MTTTRTLEEYLKLPYSISVVRDEDDEGNEGWVAEVAELPGCMTQGRTLEEVAGKIRDAMAGWISVALEDGVEIPEPRNRHSFSGRFLLRLPSSLHAELVFEARREGVSLNQYAMSALAGAVGWRGMQANGDGKVGDRARASGGTSRRSR